MKGSFYLEVTKKERVCYRQSKESSAPKKNTYKHDMSGSEGLGVEAKEERERNDDDDGKEVEKKNRSPGRIFFLLS